MIRRFVTALSLAAASLTVSPVLAQTTPDTLIVLDGSGSMWGQIEGRTKIEIARETLSSVLSEVSPGMNIGMIAYGHRVRGQCSDIETLVPMGPANQTVPQMIDAANRINPRGMTPLSDAVRKAAEEMLYTERAATVVLITDGIETCEADPCALGRELEAAGIDFTAHVVGFGLTGDEGRQVACLAENTGGRYVPADDADQLVDALRETIVADDSDFVDEEEDFVEEDPALPTKRRVEFTFRDTSDGPKLQTNELDIRIEPRGEATYDAWREWHHQHDYTAEGMFDPGIYDVIVVREKDRSTLRAHFEIEVPEGADTLVIDRAIAAKLRVNTLVHAGQRIEHGKGTPAANRSDNGRGVYELVPVVAGVADEDAKITFGYRADLDIAAGPGDYVLRGTFARSVTREKLISIAPGETKEIDFDFELAKVWVAFRDAGGLPAARPYTRVSDEPGGSAFFASGRDVLNNEKLPWYLPVGSWRLDTGHEGGSNKRAQLLVTVSRPGEEITLQPTEGQRLTDADIARMSDNSRIGCLGFGGTEHGRNACIVEKVDFSAAQDSEPDETEGGGQSEAAAADGDFAAIAGLYGRPQTPEIALPMSGNDLLDACFFNAFVFYPDGFAQGFREGFAQEPTPGMTIPPEPVMHTMCSGTPQSAECETKNGAWPEGSPAPAKAQISAKPNDIIELCMTGNCFQVQQCKKPRAAFADDPVASDGRHWLDHVLTRPDNGPGLE